MQVLICDDDEEIRATMRRSLRGYEVTEVESPRDAVATLKTCTFDAIISDFSLNSDTDGLDLLQHVRVQYPQMVRFLVTGNREIAVAARAINEGAVHRYFSKPWGDSQLRDALALLLRARFEP